MLAAGGYKVFKALRHPVPGMAPEHWDMVLLGCVVSAIVSFIAVKWLLGYIRTHTFTLFGWYRVALAALIAILLLKQG
jgi:undecaprenyl-diphosphatase